MHTRSITPLLLLVLSGCIDTSAPMPDAPPLDQVLSVFRAHPSAVTFAVGDTLPITVMARNIFGAPIPVEPSQVSWLSPDEKHVTVTANGVVRGVAAIAEPVRVIAAWTHNAVTRRDTIEVAVTATRQSVASIRIIPLDSTRSGYLPSLDLTLVSFIGTGAFNAAGQPVSGVFVPVHVDAGAGILKLGTRYLLLKFNTLGDFWIRTSANVYGVDLSDSVKYQGLYPAELVISIGQDSLTKAYTSAGANGSTIVQPCALIRFRNTTQTPIGIAFDDPSKATGCVPADPVGDIATIGANQNVVRKFRNEGTITWTVKRLDTGALVPSVSGQVTMKNP